MGQVEQVAWLDAAAAAAVRLAAEAGADVDDLLEHGTTVEVHAFQVSRLEQSADLPEVAADLAGLLWAECADVPPIATILEEPAVQATLEAVAEARRQAAARLAGREHLIEPTEPAGRSVTIAVAAPTPDAVAQIELPEAPTGDLAVATAVGAPEEALRRRSRVTVLAGVAAAILLFGRRLRGA